jgi:DNA primase
MGWAKRCPPSGAADIIVPLVPREKIDDVRDRTNIVEIIKRYVELKRAGTGSWKGLCPFHTEKTPSFHVHEPRQFFHCFGCGEKGDVITFLVKVEQRSFMEVIRDLAVTAGVELDERPMSAAEQQARREAESERDRMYRVMDLAAQFFEDAYAGPGGEAARDYVAKRGITAKVSERFRVGYAPARWDALQSFLSGKKIPASDLERLGLAGVNERGRYDFFRDRVMLPVIDRQKRVIGFGGRLLDPEAKDRKYVNSPDSPLFHKKEQLYGLHAASDAIRRGGVAILVEGNFDVLTLHEAGIEEAVAPMGTALTVEQIALVGRLAKTVVVVFDGDTAGQRAAQKAVPLFVEADVDGRVARLPPGIDPDDFVRQGADGAGAAAFRRLVEHARPMLDQFIQDAVQESGIQGTVTALESVAGLLVKVRNQTTRELYARQLGAVLGLSPQQVGRAMRDAADSGRLRSAAATPTGAGAPSAVPNAAAAQRPLPMEELHFLVLLASYPELARMPEVGRGGELLVDPAMRQLFRAAAEQIAATGRIDVPVWLDTAPAEVRNTVGAALMDGSIARVNDPAAAFSKLYARLQLLRIEAEISMSQRLQNDAQARGDDAAVRAILVRGIELNRTKRGLEAALQRP